MKEFTLSPSDTIVLQFDFGNLPKHKVEEITEYLRKTMSEVFKNQILILPKTAELSIIKNEFRLS